MRLRARFLVSFLMVVSLLMVVGLVGWWAEQRIRDGFSRIIHDTAPALLALGDIQAAAARMQEWALSTALMASTARVPPGLGVAQAGEAVSYQEASEILDHRVDRYATLVADPQRRAFLEHIRQASLMLHERGLALIDVASRGAKGEEFQEANRNLEEAEEAVKAAGGQALEVEAAKLMEESKAAGRVVTIAQSMNLTAMVLGVLLAVLLGVLLTNRIVQPIQQLVRGTEALAQGHYAHRVNVRTNDEIGMLAAHFNEMARSLERSVGELKAAYSELKDTQAQLIQSEKLALMGQMAASIAHELKNPLAITAQGLGYLETARTTDDDAQQRAEVLSLMKEGMDRAQNIIQELLDLARPPALQVRPESLQEVIRTSLALVKEQYLLERITVGQKFAEGSVRALLDRDRMQQVFINLITNAVQAMPHGGQLTLRTTVQTFTEPGEGVGRRANDFFQLGQQAVICQVQDTGVGIPKEKLQKIFDPFFTTKPRGQGTGLGLAIVRSIVLAHRGLIRVESQEGQGTTFTLTLPLA